MAIEHATPQENGHTFVEEGKALLADVIDATEEGREAQRIKNTLNLAGLLSKVPALSGVKPGATLEEREQAKYESFAKIEIGAEIGLKPAESLRAIYFDQNGAGIDIHTRVAMAIATGRHRFKIQHLNETGASIQWFQKREGQWHACEPTRVTREQLRGTQVWEKGKQIPITEKWNYKSWWEDMVYGFCQRRNIRRYAPETQGSFAIAPAEEEVMEDAGVTEGAPMTAERHAENVDEMCGTPTPDTAVQDAAKAAATPEAQAQTERQGLLLDIMHLREQFKIGTGAIHTWAEQSEARTPWGFTHGIGKAPLATLRAMRTHLQTYGAQSCAVLLGDVPVQPDDPEEDVFLAEFQDEQPALPGVDAATTRSEEPY